MSALAPLIAFSHLAQSVPRLCFLTFDASAARTTKFAEFFDGLRGLGHRMLSEASAPARQRDMPLGVLIARAPHDGCGGGHLGGWNC
jgi:hypothetical protein